MSNFDQRLQAGWRIWSEDSPVESESPEPLDPRWMRELDQIAGTGPKKTRSVPLKLLVPMLINAQRRCSAWLDDFSDDLVVIDADLHEVLLAFEKLQQESNYPQTITPTRRAAA